MNLNKEELKKTAELFRKGLPKDSNSTIVPVDSEQVQIHVTQLEQHVIEFAANGHTAVDYNFKFEFAHVRNAVAKAFKLKNPQLFVMEHAGHNKITITWDDNNYV